MRNVLVIAYYFPPMGLSGVQRVAKFVKYLPLHGWQPTVLTIEPAGYFAFDSTLQEEMDEAGVVVHRTASWDPTRIFGSRKTVALPSESRRRWLTTLSQVLFVPDNKVGWLPHALRTGKRLLREQSFDAIFSSAPPYTAHLVAARLSRRSGLPLVLDFRDDWVGNPRHVYPTPLHRTLNRRMERDVMRTSSHAIAINQEIRQGLIDRNRTEGFIPSVSVLPQGYDPEDFEYPPVERRPGTMRLLYTGIFYDAQKPDNFFRALARLLDEDPAARKQVEAVFVGLVPDDSKRLAQDLGIAAHIRYEGYVPHDKAVAHQQAADVLWMTIGRRPGADGISTSKLFEYMGARKPILALVPEGAARRALQPYGAACLVPPDDVPAITAGLRRMLEAWRQGKLPRPDEAYVQRFDRRVLAGRLAALLEAVNEYA